jgi:hypothetical protein
MITRRIGGNLIPVGSHSEASHGAPGSSHFEGNELL